MSLSYDFLKNWRDKKEMLGMIFEENSYETYDSWLPQLNPTKNGTFYKTELYGEGFKTFREVQRHEYNWT